MGVSNRSKAAVAPPNIGSPEWRRTFTNWMYQFNQGKMISTGTVTLTAGSATTTVTDPKAGVTSYVGLMPRTSNAALSIPSIGKGAGSFTLTHANNAQTDRTYTYCLMG